MQFLNRSFSGRIFFTLIPFTIVVAGLYTFLMSSSIYFAEDHILKEYLRTEHQKFSELVARSEHRPQPPFTSYLKGYWEDDPGLPPQVLEFASGYHERISDDPNEDQHLLIAEIPDSNQRLFLLLQEQHFSAIGRYDNVLNSILYTVAGLVVIASAILATIIARLLSRPVTELAEDVSSEWKAGKVFSGYDREDEIGTLSQSFTQLAQRLQDALDKEKSFTRHASHEMRTPVAVIRNALSVLKLPNCSEEKRLRNIQRVETACLNAERMLDVFLCLGQDQSTLAKDQLEIKDCIESSLANYSELQATRKMHIEIHDDSKASIHAPTSLFEVVIDNLIRNALNYGETQLQITLTGESIIFSNPIGAAPLRHDNYGYGLEIIRRICEYLNWSFHIDQREHTFTATIDFKTTSATVN